MKMRNVAAATAAILLGTGLSSLNWAQDGLSDLTPDAVEWDVHERNKGVEAQLAAAKEAAKVAAKAAAAARREEIHIRKFMPAVFGQPRHLTQIQEAAERYSNSQDEEQKEKALQQLRDLASQYFEEDMEVRKKELQNIEARLEKLRGQLDRRRAKKDEIVELQVKVAINEAEGLGFTSAPRNDFKFDIRVPGPQFDAGVNVLAAPSPSADVIFAPAATPVYAPAPVKVSVPAPPAPPLGGSQLLGVGAKGDAVRLLQKVLNERMEPTPDLKVDGDFGPETEKAVRAFQAEHGLDETGVLDEATRERLDLPKDLPPFITP